MGDYPHSVRSYSAALTRASRVRLLEQGPKPGLHNPWTSYPLQLPPPLAVVLDSTGLDKNLPNLHRLRAGKECLVAIRRGRISCTW